MRPHRFMPDPSATDRPGGEPRCLACGFPKTNLRFHDVPEVTDEQRELDARKIGESVSERLTPDSGQTAYTGGTT